MWNVPGIYKDVGAGFLVNRNVNQNDHLFGEIYLTALKGECSAERRAEEKTKSKW